jgi:hypothetical protein
MYDPRHPLWSLKFSKTTKATVRYNRRLPPQTSNCCYVKHKSHLLIINLISDLFKVKIIYQMFRHIYQTGNRQTGIEHPETQGTFGTRHGEHWERQDLCKRKRIHWHTQWTNCVRILLTYVRSPAPTLITKVFKNNQGQSSLQQTPSSTNVNLLLRQTQIPPIDN